MKRKVFTSVVLILFLGLITITFENCTKEGPTGPAGPAGSDGADANAVTAADQAAYDAADGILGGKYYSKFYDSSLGLGITDTNITAHGNFFRCKQCHGWDRLGNKGAYINRAPNSSRPAVAASNLISFVTQHNIREVFDAIKNTGGRNKMTSVNKSLDATHPDFGLILSDAVIWDIVKFLKAEAFNTYNLYDLNTSGVYPTGTRTFTNVGKDGDAAAGNTYYSTNCSGCHGADGTAIALDGASAYIGDFLRDHPYETQHKVKFGSVGSTMDGFSTATETDVKNLLVAGRDTVAFPGL